MYPLVFPIERISKRTIGEIGNVEHLQRIIQDSFNYFTTSYNSKMVFNMAAKTFFFLNLQTIISEEKKEHLLEIINLMTHTSTLVRY